MKPRRRGNRPSRWRFPPSTPLRRSGKRSSRFSRRRSTPSRSSCATTARRTISDRALRPYLGAITLVRKENGGEGSSKAAASRRATGRLRRHSRCRRRVSAASGWRRCPSSPRAPRPRRAHDRCVLRAGRADDPTLLQRGLALRGRRPAPDDPRAELRVRRRRDPPHSAARGRRVRRHTQVRRRLGSLDPDDPLGIEGRSGRRALDRYRIAPTALSSQRLPLFRGYLAVLETAAARRDLGPEERRAVEATIDGRRREVLRLELREALAGLRPADVRARAAQVAREPGLPIRTRIKAVATLLAPRLAARMERRRRGATWVGAGGIVVGGDAGEV